jgi:hypothetical protein
LLQQKQKRQKRLNRTVLVHPSFERAMQSLLPS